MTGADRGPGAALAAASALAWAVLLFGGGAVSVPALCAAGAVLPPGAALEATLTVTPLAALALAWGLMIVAMMAPLLPAPLAHLRARSFAGARTRACAGFLAGYGLVWAAAGVPLVALALTLRLAAPGDWAPALLCLAGAALWQAAPARRRALNRCHRLPPVPAFGAAAALAPPDFGIRHGLWCATTCAPLMLVTLLVPAGHLLAMALAAAWLGAERIERPFPPRWSFRPPTRLARAALARLAPFRRGRLTPSAARSTFAPARALAREVNDAR
ncbi:DUF2182 domain-containing protein [Amaricoccus solimangrovi]|uniref:DUF2182 domain-containing protein n=1 Tax=Amaricoccus solimangrovi TaxID=2589815 RepID=A0A501WYD6_9RHOB|nr:DUF2182 domain-containing protein [Amaricoccus solimangrovi]TPE52517.1 DUF2182 domain-containing protein [Amaricoccus solimangrovi]